MFEFRWNVREPSIPRGEYSISSSRHCLIVCDYADTNQPYVYQSDAPLYRRAWAACLALGGVWLATIIVQTILFKLSNRRFAKKVKEGLQSESEGLYVDRKDHTHRYYW